MLTMLGPAYSRYGLLFFLSFAWIACGGGSSGSDFRDPEVTKSCEELGLDMASADMEIGAGRADINLPSRSSNVDIENVGSPPILLNQENTQYTLKANVTAPLSAFEIAGNHITLNLNGYTVTYGTGDSADGESFGIHIQSGDNVVVANGTIVQGGGNCKGSESGEGCNPIRAEGGSNIEIGGLNIEWHTDDTDGIAAYWIGGSEVHHNTLTDKGDWITNRHQGIHSIHVGSGGSNHVHHNKIIDSRHMAISAGSGSEVSYNEIHIKSRAVNSYGIIALESDDYEIHHNKIFGAGAMPIGIFMGGAEGSNGSAFSNYMEMENDDVATSGGTNEGGNLGSAGIRTTWGGVGFEVMCNHILVRGGTEFSLSEHPWYGAKSWGRAIWTGDIEMVVHDNIFESISTDDETYTSSIAVVSGGDSSQLLFQENTVISNHTLVALSDHYGNAVNYPQFVRNRFVRTEEIEAFRTIRSLNSWQESTGIFLDNEYEGGSDLSESTVDMGFNGEGKKEVIVGRQTQAGFDISYYLTNVSETIESGSSVENFNDGKKVLP